MRLTGNPVTQSAATRHEIVARVSRLSQLNGSLIADQERKDAEIRYLRRVLGLVKTADAETNATNADESPKNPTFAGRLQTGSEAVAANHPRLEALLGSYGELSAHVARAKGDGSMGDDMISVTLVCASRRPRGRRNLSSKDPGQHDGGEAQAAVREAVQGARERAASVPRGAGRAHSGKTRAGRLRRRVPRRARRRARLGRGGRRRVTRAARSGAVASARERAWSVMCGVQHSRGIRHFF